MNQSSRPSRRLLEALALKVREARRRRGLSLDEAARRASLSRRFLVEIEAGRTNPSIGKLAALAGAFGVPLREMCDLPLGGAPPMRIALIGMRGAGKTTLGKALAESLEIPFGELDESIEELAGVSRAEIFEFHGETGYRRLESEALESWLAHHGEGILAVPGGIVSSSNTYERLRATCRTIWLQASPEEHWNRVVAQGDLRPMHGNPRAMEQLRRILSERTPLYRQAEFHLDTSQRQASACVDELKRFLTAP
ncbi:MAG: helix-turn-helix domain-containing protein [Planctomycetota bacterium]|nr:MAG: helix-turn-helix domain-containing protein [Planctomycetota bacterium]